MSDMTPPVSLFQKSKSERPLAFNHPHLAIHHRDDVGNATATGNLLVNVPTTHFKPSDNALGKSGL